MLYRFPNRGCSRLVYRRVEGFSDSATMPEVLRWAVLRVLWYV